MCDIHTCSLNSFRVSAPFYFVTLFILLRQQIFKTIRKCLAYVASSFFQDCLDMWVILGECCSNSWQKDGCDRRGQEERKDREKAAQWKVFEQGCVDKGGNKVPQGLWGDKGEVIMFFLLNGPHCCFFLWCCKTLEPCELCEQSNNYVIKVIFQLNYIETLSSNKTKLFFKVFVCVSARTKRRLMTVNLIASFADKVGVAVLHTKGTFAGGTHVIVLQMGSHACLNHLQWGWGDYKWMLPPCVRANSPLSSQLSARARVTSRAFFSRGATQRWRD